MSRSLIVHDVITGKTILNVSIGDTDAITATLDVKGIVISLDYSDDQPHPLATIKPSPGERANGLTQG